MKVGNIRTNVEKLNELDYENEMEHLNALGGDADSYRKMGMDYAQLVEIRHGLESGVDISIYDKPTIPWFQMEEIRLSLEAGVNIKKYVDQKFDWMQLSEIRKGLELNIDVSCYAKAEFVSQQMHEIRIGLENGIDVEVYVKPEYDWFQMEEIRKGLERGDDISRYVGKGYDYLTMRQIRKAMEKNIDLLPYVKKGYQSDILVQIRRCLENKILPDSYLDAGYLAEQLEQIIIAHKKEIDITPFISVELMGIQLEEIMKGLEAGVDVSIFAKAVYGWQQMREIRLGLENRIDVSLYSSPYYNWQQMREIRYGLQAGFDVSGYAKLVYSITDMQRLREKLVEDEKKEEAGKTAEILVKRDSNEEETGAKGNAQVPDTEKAHNFVAVSLDGMEAELNLAKPKAGKVYTAQEVIEILKGKGVTLGIDKEVINLMLERGLYEENVVVARGQKAVAGEDGYYEYFFRTQLPTVPKVLEDGSVDYMNMDYFERVVQGQKLAVYHPATVGKGGYTENGKITVARRGKEKPVLRGKGFIILEDKNTYVSMLNGKVSISGNHLEVSKLHVVDGDVTYTTGNINFDGDLIIKGCVRSGVTLQAKGNIEIEGNVESANLIAEGDILVKQGVQAGGVGFLRAKGAVTGKFFEAVTIETDGDIRANYILNCDISTKGSLIVAGRKGILVGGRTKAIRGLEVFELGNIAQLATIIETGLTKQFFEKYNEVEKNIIKIQSEVEVFQDGIRKFESTYTKQQLTEISVYDKIKLACEMKQQELTEHLEIKDKFEKEMEQMSATKVVVKGKVYPGVQVIIDRIPLRLMESVENVTFRHIEDRVGVFRNSMK